MLILLLLLCNAFALQVRVFENFKAVVEPDNFAQLRPAIGLVAVTISTAQHLVYVNEASIITFDLTDANRPILQVDNITREWDASGFSIHSHRGTLKIVEGLRVCPVYEYCYEEPLESLYLFHSGSCGDWNVVGEESEAFMSALSTCVH